MMGQEWNGVGPAEDQNPDFFDDEPTLPSIRVPAFPKERTIVNWHRWTYFGIGAALAALQFATTDTFALSVQTPTVRAVLTFLVAAGMALLPKFTEASKP